jgi:hypothetical protein
MLLAPNFAGNSPCSSSPKSRLDAPLEALAHVAIRIHDAITCSRHGRRVGGGPVFDLDGKRARQFERRVVCFRGKRHDEIEIGVLQVVPISARAASTKGSRSPVRTPADAMKTLAGSRPRARASAIGDRIAFMPHRNRTEDGLRSVLPSASAAPEPDVPAKPPHPRQCSTQTSVKSRRAVSKSISILPESLSMRVCEPSLWRPRLPMSIASIWLGLALRIAS